MNKQRYIQLQSELVGLNELLSLAPHDAVIDRIGFEDRMARLREELESDPPPSRWPAAARITFNGVPVSGRQGIQPHFGGTAIDVFSKFINSLTETQIDLLEQPDEEPRGEEPYIMITGIARGSFGFEIEESAEHHAAHLEGPSPVSTAIEQAREIMGALAGDQESLAEAIADVNNSTVSDLRAFVKLLADSRAICSLATENNVFRFTDVQQIRRGLNNLRQENVQEGNVEIQGYFQGYLPRVRRAEFVNAETQEVLSARVDRAVPNADNINCLLNEPVAIAARTRRVGSSRLRYVITNFQRAV